MTGLADIEVHVKLKISALWASVVLCYLYGDYFGLYKPEALQEMMAGKIGSIGQVTQGILLTTSILMAVPSVMVFLSLVLRASICRWTNIVFGAAYTLLVLVSLAGMWTFDIFLGAIEMILTTLIVVYAWRWPREVSV